MYSSEIVKIVKAGSEPYDRRVTPKEGSMEEREAREREFWDEHVPSVAACLAEYRAGPDVITAAMLEAAGPLGEVSVLDFACGTGITSAWLAAEGAKVTGIDL